MTVFLILLALLGLGAGLWLLRHHRAHSKPAAPPREAVPYAPQTQVRAVEAQSHLTGAAFGQLLKAAHGDRQRVEQWIVAEQRHDPLLRRDEAIERLARRLERRARETA
ncbi:hypothetical protein EV683_10273 [Crenobacter luteus]|uniref:Uncharacterized protein n=1 Tax=Crenobacter luteus TaxID=1452487 RepID=A0A163DAY7_9NEIS|nr:hypothetical protein [Crenobacter luteus]KZE34286.1 hypothetical protein AVW16_06320 [Crenobacter luteus]TCP15156.1 hypothetical protein EV683_10273 [Crenobacter luteus]